MNTMNITDIARSLSRLDDDEADALVGVYAAPGREAYVAWVAEWKKALHEEVALIRSLKAVRRDKSQHVRTEERGQPDPSGGARRGAQPATDPSCRKAPLGRRADDAARARRLTGERPIHCVPDHRNVVDGPEFPCLRPRWTDAREAFRSRRDPAERERFPGAYGTPIAEQRIRQSSVAWQTWPD